VQGDALHDRRIHVADVLQHRLVELLEHAGLDLTFHELRRWHDQVVTRVARQQLGLDHFIRIEDVVIDLDAVLGLEIPDRIRVNVIRPVIDIEHLFGVGGGSGFGNRRRRRSDFGFLAAGGQQHGNGTQAGELAGEGRGGT